MTDAPKLAPVVHALNCICGPCRADRAAEVRRRIEAIRREDQLRAEVAKVELAPSTWKPRKVQPGTIVALVKIGRAR